MASTARTTREGRRRAVVLGGSVAGLAAAAALAPRFEEVVVLERHGLPAPGAVASVAPHGHQPHLLQAAGGQAIEALAPGLTAALAARGAVVGRDAGEGRWWVAGGLRRRDATGVTSPMCSRPLLESTLRDHVAGLGVRLEGGVTARGVRLDGDRVVAVDVARSDGADVLAADLVVDASGRGSATARWLADLGRRPAPLGEVHVGIAYTTVEVERRLGDLDGAYAVVQEDPPRARIGVALPAEGGRWLVVLGGYHGDVPPRDPAGLLAFAASLPDPCVHDLVAAATWRSEPSAIRFPSSRWRHAERDRHPPGGLVAVGDAVSSFNPVYGQGMSSALLQAVALGAALDAEGNGPRLPHAVARRVAGVVANPWQIAVSADHAVPGTTGTKPHGTATLNRYVARIHRACAVDPVVNRAMTRVQHLLDPPAALLAPAIAARVLGAHRPPSVAAGARPAPV